ncbi:alpha/beta hydrolase [Myxococcus faecalis]|uniref:alpha/beta fold hydrolase n=1 Tax=Myxococcus faecalis TaxID=3115646 RepID=UPI003CEDADB6
MSRTVLMFGVESLLGSHLVADALLSPREPGELVHCGVSSPPLQGARTGPLEAIRHAARHLAPTMSEGVREELLAARLRWVVPGAWDAPVDELWCLSSAALEVLPRSRIGELNLVSQPSVSTEELERQLAGPCGARDIPWRLFRPGLLLGVPSEEGTGWSEGLLPLLSALHTLKHEVEERAPGYFDHHALRVRAPIDAQPSVLPVHHAVKLSRGLASRPDTRGRVLDLVAPVPLPFAELCEHLGLEYGLSLLAVGPHESLAPVDRLFQLRLRDFERHLHVSPPRGSEELYAFAGVEPRALTMEPRAWRSMFRAVRKAQDVAHAERRRRVDTLWSSLRRSTVAVGGDSELTCLSGGMGEPPVVILNALGQGLRYWARLVERLLSKGRRVLLWEPREATRPLLLEDQVKDLEAVLNAEGVSRCHLVGWCTGASVAVEFSLRHPDAVVSSVFLNPSFKCDGGPKELDTDYEETLEPLFRMLDRRPAMVSSVTNSLRTRASAHPPDSTEVLTRMNRDLETEVLAPFRTEASTLDYARQLIDFWAYDVRARAREVRAPVLLLGGELDRVASSAAACEVARRFADGRYLEVHAGTHYCLYDRPALVAEVMERFFEDPRQVDGLSGEVEHVR